ncbi:MAG: metallophosphoesterase family protein [Planctomycetes bacterium]|nr:metallophosphoesterase family protein [Planctomycetota bacterium]
MRSAPRPILALSVLASTVLASTVLASGRGAMSPQEPATPRPERPRHGQPVVVPEGSRALSQTYGFLSAHPTARIVAPGRLEIVLETRSPCPPATVYLGLSTLDEDLDWPRYRVAVREAGKPSELRTTHRIETEFASLVAKLPHTPFEPRVQWRAEIWVPELGSSRFAEGRVYFDRATLGDTVNVGIGPFVEQLGPDAVTVWWETDREARSELRIAAVGDATEPRVVAARAEGRRVVARVDGLAPGTRYAYRAVSGATVVRAYEFKTPAPGAFRFVAMVDSREGVGGGMLNAGGVEAASLKALTTIAWRGGAEFALFAGDLINGYTTSVTDFELMLDAFRRATAPVHARIPFYVGMGNHEALIDAWRTPEGRVFYADKNGDESAEAVFGRMFLTPQNGPTDEGPGTPGYRGNVYWFDHGNARIVVLNNNYWWCSDPHRRGGNLEGFVMERQLAWLAELVAATDADPAVRHLFFAAQEPPFPNGGHTADAMWYRHGLTGQGGDTDRDGDVDDGDIDIVGNRNRLWELVASSAKSVAFITGDEHAYSRVLIRRETPIGRRSKPDGTELHVAHAVWQITSGGAGAPFYDKELDLPWSGELAAHSTMPHCAMFTVDGPKVSLEVFANTGQRIDAVELR